MNENSIILYSHTDEKREYLEFDHKPSNPRIVKEIQNRCLYLLKTRKDSSNAKIAVTADGKEYSSENPDKLLKGIKSLTDAESFSIDIYYYNFEYKWEHTDFFSDEGDVNYTFKHEYKPFLELLAKQIIKSERFFFKSMEFFADTEEV